MTKLTEWLESKKRAIEQDRGALKLQHSQEIQGLQARVDKLNLASMMHGEGISRFTYQLLTMD